MQRNIKLVISYKGTDYCGWQRQPNGISIEGTVTDAIKRVTGEVVTLYGSGRTDAGVHAKGQCANFHTQSRIPAHKFCPALNTKLPKTIRILESSEVSEDFHSRFSAKGKVYAYQLYLAPVTSPFYDEFAWHCDRPLDIAAMEAASRHFIGSHDFKGFMATGSAVKDTVREITAITFTRQGPLLTITYTGKGFLYNMVRIITGTLYAVGLGKIDGDALPAIIASGERARAGITAPAKGLFLERVLYE